MGGLLTSTPILSPNTYLLTWLIHCVTLASLPFLEQATLISVHDWLEGSSIPSHDLLFQDMQVLLNEAFLHLLSPPSDPVTLYPPVGFFSLMHFLLSEVTCTCSLIIVSWRRI